jgi:hypothetical protein
MGKWLLVWIAFCIALLGFLGVQVYRQWRYDQKFNGWVQDCTNAGGVAQQTAALSVSAKWYDCMVDGKRVVLPGYEQDEKERPKNLYK